ncbi:hypothetical protein [Bacillus subtilis]|uniref:hypothetical protein n=1 Tax=Bacillus TaxID=1386 RepID=UPI003AF21255
MAAAKYRIENSCCLYGIQNPKTHCMCKRGTALCKKLDNDMAKCTCSEPQLKSINRISAGSQKMGLFNFTNAYSTKLSYVYFKKEILKTGYPRNDILHYQIRN